MDRESKRGKERDYGPEVIGFIALIFLSAMSHFWYPLIATGGLFALSAVITVIGELPFPPSRTSAMNAGWGHDRTRNSIQPRFGSR